MCSKWASYRKEFDAEKFPCCIFQNENVLHFCFIIYIFFFYKHAKSVYLRHLRRKSHPFGEPVCSRASRLIKLDDSSEMFSAPSSAGHEEE